jgi:hypothetical protein
MRRMRQDAKKAIEWEAEMSLVNTKRAEVAESLRAVYASLESQRSAAWHAEAAKTLGLETVEEVSYTHPSTTRPTPPLPPALPPTLPPTPAPL